MGMRETEVHSVQVVQDAKGGVIGPRYTWNGMLDSPPEKAAATTTPASRQRTVLCIVLLSANSKQVGENSSDSHRELRSVRLANILFSRTLTSGSWQ